MYRSPEWILGKARGPIRLLAPQTRIILSICGILLCLLLPADMSLGSACIILVMASWLTLCLPPGKVIIATFCVGLVTLGPVFLFVPWIQVDGPLSQRFMIPWVVFLRGTACLIVGVSGAASLTVIELWQGILPLPVPRLVSAIGLQVIHQGLSLLDEGLEVTKAIASRGGTAGLHLALRVVGNLPRVWLVRVIEKAHRVGDAMEVRGFCQLDLRSIEPVQLRLADTIAIVGGSLLLVVAVFARLYLIR